MAGQGSLRQLADIMASPENALQHLRQHHCVRRTAPDCPTCQRPMTWVRFSRTIPYLWRCPRHRGNKVTPRSGSFFHDSKLPLVKLVGLIYCWANDIPNNKTVRMVEVSHETVVEWFKKLRGVCTWWIRNNPEQIGGVGIIAEIDESLMAKRKYNVGHGVRQRWVFGGVCQHGRGFLQLVPDRSAATLLPIIREHIAPGTVIHSDMWAAYNGIQQALPANLPPYQHFTVNHSQNFVDPVSNACTNHVECYWKNCKSKFKRMAGVASDQLESYLNEFMWRQRHPNRAHHMERILEAIAQMHPTP